MLDLSTTTASNIIAVTLGLFSLLLGVILPSARRWWGGRRAELEVRFERFWRQDTRRLADRIVIINHGPAISRDVTLTTVLNTAGEKLDINERAASATPPVELLLPNQKFHVIIELPADQADPEVIEAVWWDRSRKRSARFIVSPQFL